MAIPQEYDYPFQPVKQTLEELLPDFDHQVVEILLATVIANWAKGPAVWLELVAPASLGKTTILEPLARVQGARILSKLTPRTLLSGSGKKDEDPSLLNQLGSRPFIVIKEMSSILAGDGQGNTEIFAQLREVYDGYIMHTFGTGVTRSWKGKALVIAGVTPKVDKFLSFESELGERFVRIRFESDLDPEALALAAWDRCGTETNLETELHKSYKYAVDTGIENLELVELSTDTIKKLAALATFAAYSRTHVDRNIYRGDRVEATPAPEGTPRIMKNLGLMAKGLAALFGTVDLSETQLDSIRRVGVDCMPEPRRSTLLKIVEYNTKDSWAQPKDLNGIVSGNYIYQILEDLELLGAIRSRKGEKPETGKTPKEYHLSDTMIGYANRSGLIGRKSTFSGII